MQTICVSRGSYRRGKELAESLAAKLDYPCFSREQLIEGAVDRGIPVGKLEEAVVKRRPLTEALALVADRFKAYVTLAMGERILKGGLVYHGRAGHLVLAGLPHVLRVRAITDMEDRVESVMGRLGLSHEKARAYVEGVDDDIRRWIRTLYNLDVNDPALFNVTVNCSKMSVPNVAAALVTMSQLPEFQITPAAVRRVESLLLAARCRLALAEDERTRSLSVKVRAEAGEVAVTYPPRQAREAEAIPVVLETVAGINELRWTVATSTIVWVQERFDPRSETCTDVLDIADRWNAAVDLVRLVSAPESSDEPGQVADPASMTITAEQGGILDDVDESPRSDDDGGVSATMDHLIRSGRAGATCTVCSAQQSLIGSVCDVANVSLVVLGDLYLDRPGAVRKRLTRDLAGRLGDRLRAPVIGAEELKHKFLFGPRQWLRMLGLLAAVVVIYLLVFTNQEPILAFLVREGGTSRALAAAALVALVPLVAYLWGSAAQYLLRLARFE